jgi:hypothetical protein
MKIRITEEQFKVINKSDLGDVWSGEYHIKTEGGKKPYTKRLFHVEEVPRSRYSGHKTYFYLTDEEADQLNELGREIRNKIEEFNGFLDSID